MTNKTPPGFVPLATVRGGPPDSKAALAEIRDIYFKTTKRTIDHDIAHAIELLKSLNGEDERDKVAVYMHGLAEMQKEWSRPSGDPAKRNKPTAAKAKTRKPPKARRQK